jgi:hypothetical protein
MQAKSLTAHCHCQQDGKYDRALDFMFHEVVWPFGSLGADCKSVVRQTANKLLRLRLPTGWSVSTGCRLPPGYPSCSRQIMLQLACRSQSEDREVRCV